MAAGVPTARFAVIDAPKTNWPMGWDPPVVLKPARQGSSVGLNFVGRVADWNHALAEAMSYDSRVLMEEKISGRECHRRHSGRPGAADCRSAAEDGRLRLPKQIHRRRDGISLPGAVQRGSGGARPGSRARRVPGDWRARLCAGGRDGARKRRTGGVGSKHAAGDDGDQFAAESGRRRGHRLRGTLPAHGGPGASAGGTKMTWRRFPTPAPQATELSMWFRRTQKNRRLNRGHVLDVKLRSDQVRATRTRLAVLALGVAFGTFLGLYLLWRTGDWALDRLVYENRTFAIQQIEVQTDGVIAPDQLRLWARVKPGDNLLALDLARVKRDLELVPLIGSVSVERILPRTLRIRVTEREPVAQVNVPRRDDHGGVEVVAVSTRCRGLCDGAAGPAATRHAHQSG